MTLTRKGTRAAAAGVTTEDILDSDPETVASGETEKEYKQDLEGKKRDKSIAERIGQPFKPTSRNKDEEY